MRDTRSMLLQYDLVLDRKEGQEVVRLHTAIRPDFPFRSKVWLVSWVQRPSPVFHRFLHVFLLRLAFTFPLSSEHLPSSSSLCGLERRCLVWRNGISWKSVSGVSTIVEIVDRNRWVVVLVSEKSREAVKTCCHQDDPPPPTAAV